MAVIDNLVEEEGYQTYQASDGTYYNLVGSDRHHTTYLSKLSFLKQYEFARWHKPVGPLDYSTMPIVDYPKLKEMSSRDVHGFFKERVLKERNLKLPKTDIVKVDSNNDGGDDFDIAWDIIDLSAGTQTNTPTISRDSLPTPSPTTNTSSNTTTTTTTTTTTNSTRIKNQLPLAAGPSFWDNLKTPEDETRLCKEGLIHFRGTIVIKDSGSSSGNGNNRVKICVKLGSPCYDQSNRFGREYGSDRFLRLNLGRGSLWLSTGESDQSTHSAKRAMKTFLSRPIVIVGRFFYPFSVKDDSIFYFATGGKTTGLETVTLKQFVDAHIPILANQKMKIPKFIARFHLGLSRTIPTISFTAPSQVKVVPDIFTNSLRISPRLMEKIALYFDFDFGYVPSAIEGKLVLGGVDVVGPTLVWVNDYGRSGRWRPDDYKIELRLPEQFSESSSSSSSNGSVFDNLSSTTTPSTPSTTPSSSQQKESSSSIRIRFYSRESVGENGEFAQTDCSIEIRRSEIVDPRDPLPGRREPEELTDGCGLMSRGAMEELRDVLDLEEIPSAVQARLGGSKGMWCIEPSRKSGSQHWIEIRPSQLKFEISSDQNLDLEVIGYTKPAGPVSLGKQVLPVLQQNHVPTKILEELIRERIEERIEPLFKLQNDLPALQQYIEKSENILGGRKNKIIGFKRREYMDESIDEEAYNDEDEELGEKVQNDDDEDPYSYAPQTIGEVVVQMLSSGFTFEDSALALKFRTMVHTIIDRTLSFQVPVSRSTNLYVIPDPVGILRPDEIFVQLSSAFVDPDTRLPMSVLEDIDALVTRSPCVARSGIRKVTARNYRELNEYFNVIIFPTSGDRSLCSLLGGGDYDGDTVMLVWDHKIVDAFSNSSLDDVDSNLPTEVDFEVDSRTVKEVVNPLFVDDGRDYTSKLSLLLTEKALFAQRLYGKFSNWHTTLSYQLGFKDPVVARAGYLFEKTLDAPKQGHFLRPHVYKEFQEQARKRVALKAAEAWRPARGEKKTFIHNLDKLIFNPPWWTLSDKKKGKNHQTPSSNLFPERLVGGKFVLDELVLAAQALEDEWQGKLEKNVSRYQKWEIDAVFLDVWKEACEAANKPVTDFKPLPSSSTSATTSVVLVENINTTTTTTTSRENNSTANNNLSRTNSDKSIAFEGENVPSGSQDSVISAAAILISTSLRRDLDVIEDSCRSCLKSYIEAHERREVARNKTLKDGTPRWLAYRQDLSEISERLLAAPTAEQCSSPWLNKSPQTVRKLKAALCYLLAFENDHKLSVGKRNDRHFFVLDIAFRDFISIKADAITEEYGKKRIGDEIIKGARAHPIAPTVYPTLGVKRTRTHYIEKANKRRRIED